MKMQQNNPKWDVAALMRLISLHEHEKCIITEECIETKQPKPIKKRQRKRLLLLFQVRDLKKPQFNNYRGFFERCM